MAADIRYRMRNEIYKHLSTADYSYCRSVMNKLMCYGHSIVKCQPEYPLIYCIALMIGSGMTLDISDWYCFINKSLSEPLLKIIFLVGHRVYDISLERPCFGEKSKRFEATKRAYTLHKTVSIRSLRDLSIISIRSKLHIPYSKNIRKVISDNRLPQKLVSQILFEKEIDEIMENAQEEQLVSMRDIKSYEKMLTAAFS